MTMLTMTFLGLETRNDLPKVSYPTALDYFVAITFTFIFATILQFAIVHYYTKVGSGEYYFSPVSFMGIETSGNVSRPDKRPNTGDQVSIDDEYDETSLSKRCVCREPRRTGLHDITTSVQPLQILSPPKDFGEVVVVDAFGEKACAVDDDDAFEDFETDDELGCVDVYEYAVDSDGDPLCPVHVSEIDFEPLNVLYNSRVYSRGKASESFERKHTFLAQIL